MLQQRDADSERRLSIDLTTDPITPLHMFSFAGHPARLVISCRIGRRVHAGAAPCYPATSPKFLLHRAFKKHYITK
eukprot:2662624-Amphidinium_carterae.1